MTEREPLAAVLARGDLRESLEAMRDLLAADVDDVRWEKHKRECRCVCGLADTRARVAGMKQLHAFMDAIEAIPNEQGVSRLDQLAANVADEVGERRTRRLAIADGS